MRHLSPLQTKGMRLRIRLLAGVLAVGCLGGLVGRLAVLQLVVQLPLFLLALSKLVSSSYSPFLYFQF